MTLLRKTIPVVAALSLLATTACESVQSAPKQTGGTILGGALGGLAGSQIGSGKGKIVAIVGGTILGALLGSEIGKSLDRADRAAMEKAETQAHGAKVGETIRWNNPDSGNSGTVTALRDGRDTNSGAYCREYRHTVTVQGKNEEAVGTACQQPDGSWKVVN
ncbi:MAG: glycine zipper 2TM domain-containing protein [Rhodospirillales bacterium]|nr:glycine zipper 2TM domain-containing protein [Rhodospirillales bacterium]